MKDGRQRVCVRPTPGRGLEISDPNQLESALASQFAKFQNPAAGTREEDCEFFQIFVWPDSYAECETLVRLLVGKGYRYMLVLQEAGEALASPRPPLAIIPSSLACVAVAGLRRLTGRGRRLCPGPASLRPEPRSAAVSIHLDADAPPVGTTLGSDCQRQRSRKPPHAWRTCSPARHLRLSAGEPAALQTAVR